MLDYFVFGTLEARVTTPKNLISKRKKGKYFGAYNKVDFFCCCSNLGDLRCLLFAIFIVCGCCIYDNIYQQHLLCIFFNLILSLPIFSVNVMCLWNFKLKKQTNMTKKMNGLSSNFFIVLNVLKTLAGDKNLYRS